jgi:hypothetical protein
MLENYIDLGTVLAPWPEIVTGSQVAFGAIAAPGATASFSVTGAASVVVSGTWAKPPYFYIERSTDGGATWGPSAGVIMFNGASVPNAAVIGSLTGSPTTTGTALYRLRLEGLAPGAPISWAVYQ